MDAYDDCGLAVPLKGPGLRESVHTRVREKRRWKNARVGGEDIRDLPRGRRSGDGGLTAEGLPMVPTTLFADIGGAMM